MRDAQAIVSEAVVRHEQQHACGGGDASECAGEEADERKDVDEEREDWHAGDLGEDAHWGLAFAEVLTGDAEAEDFGVRADDEECAAENGALDHGSWNCFERIARFGAERGGTFEADEAEESEDEAQAEAAA